MIKIKIVVSEEITQICKFLKHNSKYFKLINSIGINYILLDTVSGFKS